MARTMSDAAEKRLRRNARQHLCLGTDDTKAILAELDAERDAHEVTKAEQVRAMRLVGNRSGGSLAFGRISVLEEELAALKARLALAEAVCESAVLCNADVLVSRAALMAWRATK